jgi:hypothetical protein
MDIPNEKMESHAMNGKFLRIEPWLYIGAFTLAVVFRLFNLGNLPLSDPEAREALKALALHGASGSGSSQPLYTLFTAGLFAIFGSNEFLARLGPALAGCLLLVLPMLLREDLGRIPAVILAYGLAIDPALVAISRQAGSAMPALSLTLLALGFLWKRRERLAGIFAGLAVLSGTSFWFGLIGIGLLFIADNFFRQFEKKKAGSIDVREPTPWLWKPGKVAWFAFGLTLILGGSLFLSLPSGFDMIVSGLLNHIAGWQTSAGISIQRILIALVIYQAVVLLLGLIEGISGWIQRNTERRMALMAFLVFLFLLIIYPGRQMQDAAWCVVFLWLLSAWLLSRLANTPRGVVLPILGHAALVSALILFLILNITWVLGGFGGLEVERILTILGGLTIIIIISFLVAYGWGIDVATRGAFVGIGLVALAFIISFSISAGGVNGRSSPDLWHQDSRVTGADVLIQDLNTFSLWETGERERLSIEVVNFDTPSLRWLLRGFKNTTYVDALATGQTPDVVITDFIHQEELSNDYRGETFAWYTTAGWSTLDTYGFLDWMFHRIAYETPINLILWVRQDLFLIDSQSIIQ